MATFFSGPRIGASGENVSPPTTDHVKRPKMVRRFRTFCFPHFYLNETTAGTPRHLCP